MEDLKSQFEEIAIPESKDISTLLSDTTLLKKCKCSYHKRFSFFKKDKKTLDRISNQCYVYAIMSSNAYERELQIDIPDWERIKRVIVRKHGFSADIYVSTDDTKVAIAFRGTDNLKDWSYGNLDTDPHGQYADADTLFQDVLTEHKGKEIIVTGHSLGGGLAMHISLLNANVDAIAFHPSPRVFVNKQYDKYDNDITIIYEAGEVLTLTRKLLKTIRKIKPHKYRYNFLGGLSVSEHSIENFARCMYASIHEDESNYTTICKKNTISFKH